MKKNNAVAPMYRPTQTYAPNPGTIAIPQSDVRTQRERVVSASNQSVPVPIALILLGVFAIASTAIGYFGGDAVGVSIPVRIVFSGTLMLVMALITMAFITGDAAALFEALQGERTERKSLDVESERIDATLQVALIAEETTQQLNQQQHDERMAEIETHQALQNMHGRLAQLEDTWRRNSEIDAGPTRTDVYVDAQPQHARIAVRDFLSSCYTADGFNSDHINGQAGGLIRSPWNSIWKHETWKGEAKQIMIDNVLEPVGSGPHPSQYRLRYSTNDDAQKAIDRN